MPVNNVAAVTNGTAENDAEASGDASQMAASERLSVGVLYDGNEYDDNIYQLLRPYGQAGFDFVCYQTGGARRAQLAPDAIDDTTADALPPIVVPDFQLASKHWGEYVCGRISPWIDLDSADANVAAASKRALTDELNYNQYLGLRAVMIELRHASAPALAAALRDRLWSRSDQLRVWVVVSASDDAALYADEEVWSVWRRFRTQVYNHESLAVCLRLVADLPDEFATVAGGQDRWLAEPLAAVRVDTDAFMCDDSGAARLSDAHGEFFRKMLFKKPKIIAVLGGSADVADRPRHLRSYKVALDALFEKRPKDEFGDFVSGFEDHLQVPLQPQTEHLDSSTYETFEKDPVKYYEYETAIAFVLQKRVQQTDAINPQLRLMVLGAGRGPLVSRALQAFQKVQKMPGAAQFGLWVTAVEKNPAAVVTLRAKNRLEWGGRVTVVHTDMRDYRPPPDERADVVVSELLGSFGDNELSPECLDGAAHLLKEDAVSIPASYTSFLAPIQSTKVWASVLASRNGVWLTNDRGRADGRPPDGRETVAAVARRMYEGVAYEHTVDHPFIARLQAYYEIAEPLPVFRFTHPNVEKSPNTRDETLVFVAKHNSEIHGFAGYFDASLTANDEVRIGIVPASRSEGMFSWFPVFFPLHQPISVNKGETIRLQMRRCVDAGGVWYEWQLLEPVTSAGPQPVQNRDGQSYYMKLS